MAGKAHVDVNERRLRPVYDALDNLNNKLAIQLADKILKKQKDLHCAKALKALALVRSGRSPEGTTLLEEVKAVGTFDDSTLQAMTICYREMQRSDMIPPMYEIAVKQNPKNEEFLSHLFMGYVRIGNYVKQQQVAMNLYKAHPKNPYYFWAVMSILMQAINSKDQKAVNSMLLPLAERMVTKFIKEGKIDAEAEVQLYLMILETMEKYSEALDVVKSDLGGKLVTLENEVSELELKYLEKLGRWTELNEKYKSMLQKCPDQWSFYRGYLDSTFRLREDEVNQMCNGTSCDSNHDSTLDLNKVEELLKEKIEENSNCRGPRLALLEYYRELVERQYQNYGDVRQSIYPLLLEYFDTFGSKQCCFSDLATVCDVLSDEDKTSLIDEFQKKLPCLVDNTDANENKECPFTVGSIHKEICVGCLRRRLGLHDTLTVDEKLASAKSLLKRHKLGLALGKDLLPTEVQYADPLALLAVYLLMDIHQEKGDMLWHLLLVLEEAAQNSPSNHQMKLLLIHLYASIGAFSPCMKLYEEAELKYIMLDTLGYRLTRHAYPLGSFQAASTLYSTTLKFFSGNQKDTPEQIIAAYKFGSFRKVPEMINFKDRLNKSLQFYAVSIEKFHLDLLMQVNRVADIISIVSGMDLPSKYPSDEILKDLVDNRDFTVLDCFESSKRRLTAEEKSMSTEHEKMFVQLRTLILRIIGLSCGLLDRTKDEQDNPPNTIHNLEESLKLCTKINQECSTNNDLRHEYPVHGPTSSRIPTYCDCSHIVFIHCCECLDVVYNHRGDNKENAIVLTEKLSRVSGLLNAEIADIKSRLTKENGNTVMFNGCVLERITSLLEAFNWIAILFGITLKLLRENSPVKKGKKKKAQQNPSTVVSKDIKPIRDFLQEVGTSLEDLTRSLKSTKVDLVEKELNEEAILKLFEKTKSPLVTRIWENIQSSYKQSLLEIDQLMEMKYKFIQSIIKEL